MQLPEMTLDAMEQWLDATFDSDRKIVAREGENGCLVSMYVLSNCPGIGEVQTGYGSLVVQESEGSEVIHEFHLSETNLCGIPMVFDNYLERTGGHSITKGTAKKLIQKVRTSEHALVA